MQLPVGMLCFSIQQPHLREKGLCLGFADILLHKGKQKQVGTSWNSHYVLCMLRWPINAYAVCVTHPQILDVSIGAPGGECANSAVSNMTNIYHMYFVFSPFFSREGHMFWQVLSVLSLHPRTQALGIASHTGSRRWWCLWWPWAPEGVHYLPWDVACPLPRQAALSFCKILFTWGMKLPARCLVWRSGGWSVPSPAIWPSCCNVKNLQWEKEN